MKINKIMCLLSVVILLLLISGCNNTENLGSNVEVLDSKINYIVINNKKIYLTKNFKDI